MCQMQLPLFPPGLTLINQLVGFEKKDNRVYYYHGQLPVFSHVLTPDVLEKAQRILYQGQGVSAVAKKLNLKPDTIRKAIKIGRLHKKKSELKDSGESLETKSIEPSQTKSERNILDSQASLGIGCTREPERISASRGELTEAPVIFTPNTDVKSAGVLFALPSLILSGLLKHSSQYFSLPKGFYGLESLFIVLAFTALLRIKSLERIRYNDPGELGKLVGLDRIPEVKTLREKIGHLSKHGNPEAWSRELAKLWMEDNPDLAGTLYVDGHVRVYHGKQTKLPKRFVSREKLCLRGITDYWVNDALGQPFFVVSQTVNSGLLDVLRTSIVPRLLKDVPYQPSEKELKENPYLFRFGIVFDREGYSPASAKELWKQRIAIYTYRKYAQNDWPEAEFRDEEVTFPNGEVVTMKLAERGVYFKSQKIWMREIRKLRSSGRQTAMVTTDFYNEAPRIAGTIFARWSQENFFKYMMEHFEIDRLIEYQTEKIDEPVKVINPRYRELESQLKSLRGKLSRKKAEYGVLIYDGEIKEKKIQEFVRKKSELIELIESLESDIEKLKKERKGINKHISFAELPESDQFKSLKKSGKQFVDTIKMIAYRAETAMASAMKDFIKKKDEARALVRQIFLTDADIEPDETQGILKVTLHNMANPRNNHYAQKLCELLNDSETVFPGTNLRLVYDLVSNQNPGGQEF